jgi:predicted metal-dependent phosphoesterase TrpH
MHRRILFAALVLLAFASVIAALLPPASLRLAEANRDLRVVRGSLHVHTRRSDGTGTVEEVAAAARRAGLQFVIMTDHGDGTRSPDPPAYRDGVLCVDAVEISTTGGHYVALGLGRTPYRLAGDPRDVIEDVSRLGGFGIAAHPLSPKPELAWKQWDAPFDGIEWLNADSEWRDEGALTLLRAFATYGLRGPETIAALFARPAPVLARWDALTAQRPVVAVAGHDAHARIGLHGNWEPAEGDISLHVPSYQSAFSSFSVHAHLDAVWTGRADRDAALLLAAIRSGHVFTAIDALASPASFTFVGRDGRSQAEQGDTLAGEGAVRFEVRAPRLPGMSLVLLRNGQVATVSREAALEFSPPPSNARSVYRAEARLDRTGDMPWILSNPIYVGSVAPSTPPPLAVTATQSLVDWFDRAAWHPEHDPRSTVGARPLKRPSSSRGVEIDIRLGDKAPSGQYGALVVNVTRGSLTGWDRLIVTAGAARPMRVSLQVREPMKGHRWIRSLYLDERARTMAVWFRELSPVEPGSAPHPSIESIDSLLFVVDTVNTQPGQTARFWIGDVRAEKTTNQVRTVSSR